jgi:glycosyltransferase involved in cell wall biosynthesis
VVPRTVQEIWSQRWDIVVLSWNVRQIELVPVLLLARRRHTAVVLWGHGLGRSGSRTAGAVRRWQAPRAAGVLTYSGRGRDEVQQFAPDQLIRVLQNTTGRPAPREGDLLRHAQRRLAFVGRLDARKRVDLLLRALADLRRSDGPCLRLDVIGDGPERARLRSTADRLGVSDLVTWHGVVTDWSSVHAVLAGCDLVIQPAAAGLSVIDAFAAARGAVVADRHAMNGPEADLVIDGQTGYRYPSPSARALTECIAKIYEEPDRLLEISERAAAVYRDHLQLTEAAAAFRAIFDEVTDREGVRVLGQD